MQVDLTVGTITNLVEYALVAWFIAKLEPLQMQFEKLADQGSEVLDVVYTLLSCIYCLTFWITLACMAAGVSIPDCLSMACLNAFIIKTVVQNYGHSILG